MKLTNTTSLSKGRKNLFKIVSKVQKLGEYHILTRFGEPYVVIISANTFEIMNKK